MLNIDKENTPIKLLFIAIGVGVVAAILSILYLNAKEAELRKKLTPKQEMRDVIVATQSLLKGTKLDAGVLAVRSVPVKYLHAEALQPGDFGVIEGKVLIQNVNKGNVILASYIDLGFPKDFSDTIPHKRRAMTIQVDEVNSINGFIRPGNRIDLFVNLPSGSTGSETDTTDSVMPVLENVEVLATGESSARDYEEKVRLLRAGFDARISRNYTALTINVTPWQAAILATAQDKGDLLALLRNRDDDSGARFDRVLPSDLLQNASQLAQDANIREAAAAAQGFIVGEDGVIRTKDGVALKNQNLIVTEDGTIMTKDGVVLSGRGLTVNEKGELVDANGNVVDPDTLKVAADGSLITEDGTVLDGPKGMALAKGELKVKSKGAIVNGRMIEGATMREDGKLVLKDGTVVDPDDIVFNEDGTVALKDGTVLAGVTAAPVVNGRVIEGATMREDGKLVLKDGTVVDPDDLVFNADGTVALKDGTVLEGVTASSPTLETEDGTVITGLNINEDGMVVLEDGTVVDPKDLVVTSDGRVFTKDGKEVGGNVGVALGDVKVNPDGTIVAANGAVISGATLNEDGMLVLEDGTIVDPNDVVIQPDGTLVTKSGEPINGLTADTTAVAALAGGIRYNVDYIVGGVSKDGVATVNKVPVEDEE